MANYSSAVTAARGRRQGELISADVQMQWFIKETVNKVRLPISKRMKIALEHMKSRVVQNISKPVVKIAGSSGRIVVVGRSKHGEFPRADTTMLMKSIFTVQQDRKGVVDGFIGTPLDYGLKLEMKMKRSFLLRTLSEERRTITKILTGPIK